MSALTPITTKLATRHDGRKGPIADSCISTKYAPLFDHLGSGKQRRRNCEAERLGGCEIDNKLELGRLIDGQIAGFRPAQNSVDIVCRMPKPLRVARSVGHERADFDKIACTENRRQLCFQCGRENACAICNNELIDRNIKRVRSVLERLKGGCDIPGTLDHEWHNFETEHTCCGLDLAHFEDGLGIANIEHDCQAAQPRDKFSGEFQSLACEFIRLDR
jgi:hypothetical protein